MLPSLTAQPLLDPLCQENVLELTRMARGGAAANGVAAIERRPVERDTGVACFCVFGLAHRWDGIASWHRGRSGLYGSRRRPEVPSREGVIYPRRSATPPIFRAPCERPCIRAILFSRLSTTYLVRNFRALIFCLGGK